MLVRLNIGVCRVEIGGVAGVWYSPRYCSRSAVTLRSSSAGRRLTGGTWYWYTSFRTSSSQERMSSSSFSVKPLRPDRDKIKTFRIGSEVSPVPPCYDLNLSFGWFMGLMLVWQGLKSRVPGYRILLHHPYFFILMNTNLGCNYRFYLSSFFCFIRANSLLASCI